MKILTAVDSIFSLFPQKVDIIFIHALSDAILQYNPKKVILPDSFDRPTLITINGNKWRVMKAEVRESTSYFGKKRIKLYIIEAEHSTAAIKYAVPSQATCPKLVPNSSPLANTQLFSTDADNWLQLSFYPLYDLPKIQEMTDEVLTIIDNARTNPLAGYNTVLNREQLEGGSLQINLNNFVKYLSNPSPGSIQWDNSGYIENGFVISSDSYVYYGSLDTEGKIRQLALQQLDYVNDELVNILSEYQLILVDWCTGSIIS
ncbi:hypothetical protein [Chitinophaga rhizophila]|uniref:Uncharacterized protein n=1 Tax=Chitinophaga rhizophila TaxID=2866212 RepID=A0ABS7GF65_9BACT|nr:hypothetical protein [Chitinophaga rhizophila]MBW8686333.1 hypothetical protein [Chitinophaga rhizophila]